jgi:hypothetical protein
MEIAINRTTRTPISTIGELTIKDNVFKCVTLEDVDRNLHSEMPLAAIKSIKIAKKTAIPTGRYEVSFIYSDRFKCTMPWLMNVPGFDRIYLHIGNFAGDTEGCILVGTVKKTDKIEGSKTKYNALRALLIMRLKQERIFITIQ